MPPRLPLNRIPWARLAIAGQWLFTHGKAQLERNLTPSQRSELADLLGKSKGRRSNLTPRQRERVVTLVRQAFFGPQQKRRS